MVREQLSGESVPDSERTTVRSEHGPLIRIVLAIRRSLLVFSIFTGFVMIASGIVVEFTLANQGVVAAMLVIWGCSAVFFGALGLAAATAFGLR